MYMLRSGLSSLPNEVGFAYRDKDAVSLLHPARIKISKKYFHFIAQGQ